MYILAAVNNNYLPFFLTFMYKFFVVVLFCLYLLVLAVARGVDFPKAACYFFFFR